MGAKTLNAFSLITSIALLVGLTGCDWFTSDKASSTDHGGKGSTDTLQMSSDDSHGPKAIDDGSVVIVEIDGVPVVTEKSLKDFIDEWAEENEQARMIIQASPEQAKLGLLEGRVNTELVIMNAKETLASDAQARAQFQAQLAKGIDRLKTVLYQEVFKDSVKEPEISAAEISEFYDENKETNPFLRIKAGGVRAVAVQFTDNDEANEFYQAVVGKPDLFEDIAGQSGLEDKVRQLGLVSAQSYGVDPAIKDTLEGLTVFPSVQIIPVADENIWIVAALEKQKAEYRPLSEASDPIKEALKQQKHEEVLINEIENLKQKYDIVYNEEYMDALKEKADQRRVELEKQFGFSLDEGDLMDSDQ